MLTTSLPDTRPNRSSLPRLFDTVADTINLAGGLPDPQLFPSSDISDSMRSMLRLVSRTRRVGLRDRGSDGTPWSGGGCS